HNEELFRGANMKPILRSKLVVLIEVLVLLFIVAMANPVAGPILCAQQEVAPERLEGTDQPVRRPMKSTRSSVTRAGSSRLRGRRVLPVLSRRHLSIQKKARTRS